MAIYHFKAQVLSKGNGRSAIAAAAYRHRATLRAEETGKKYTYEAISQDLVHKELVLPDNSPQWIKNLLDGRTIDGASEALWNYVETETTRANGQLAREIQIALPKELSREQNIDLARDYIRDQFTSAGMVADWSYHEKPGNPHIHIMLTMKPLAEEGFGTPWIMRADENGNPIRGQTGKVRYENWLGDKKEMFAQWREAWAVTANVHIQKAGLDISIDHRSNRERGFALDPVDQPGKQAGRENHKAEKARLKNIQKILERPTLLLDVLTDGKSVFTVEDAQEVIARYTPKVEEQNAALDRLLQSSELVTFTGEYLAADGSHQTGTLYTSRTLLRLETGILEQARELRISDNHRVREKSVDLALKAVNERLTNERDDRLSKSVLMGTLSVAEFEKQRGVPVALDQEQVEAVRYVTESRRLSVIVGYAGAGKSTLLEAANRAWTRDGYRVFGAALAGKATEGLAESSGIESRTIATWKMMWENDKDRLLKGDVFVLDEAGMVASRDMAMIVKEVERAGAKLVLVGDQEQLAPINAGAAFRAIGERMGYFELQGVRRQREEWAREATKAFFRGETAEALEGYNQRGFVKFVSDKNTMVQSVTEKWFDAAQKGTVLVLAHRNADVHAINHQIVEERRARGELGQSLAVRTVNGEREFSVGDNILFLKNAKLDSGKKVRNGQLGKIVGIEGQKLTVEGENGQVVVDSNKYRNMDFGYAVTIHKSQGATVDRAIVVASRTMDSHLTYVAMSRHRAEATLVATNEEFRDIGQLAQKLGRTAIKETTVDIEDWQVKHSFLETRGYQIIKDLTPRLAEKIEQQRQWIIESREKLSALWQRAERAMGVVRERQPVLRQETPAQPAEAPRPQGRGMFMPVTRTEPIEDNARRVALEQQAYRRAVSNLEKLAPAVWIDGKAAATKIRSEIESGINERKLADKILDRPTEYGTLRGSDGLLQRFSKAGAERRAVLEDLKLVASHAVQAADRLGAGIASETEQEKIRRRQMQVVIPQLSESARAFLRAAEELHGQDPAKYRDLVATRVAQNAPVMKEVEAFGKALEQRFGKDTFLRADGRPELSVSEGDQKTLQIMKPTMAAAQRVSQQATIVKHAQEQAQKQALNQSQGMKI